MSAPPDPIDALIRLGERMREPQPLEALMQLIADATAEALGVTRVSVRLLDPTRTTLLAIARAGSPLHDRPTAFRAGEGLIGWIVQNDQIVRVDDAERDPRFVARPGLAGPVGAFVGAPIRAGAHCAGVISAVSPDAPFDARQEQTLALSAALCAPYLELARLARLSRLDPLAGRGLDADFPEVVASGDGPVALLSVAVAIIAPPVDDTTMREAAVALAGGLRAGDAVVRLDDNRLLLVLPGVDHVQAERIAQRAHASLAPHAFAVGVAERWPGEGRDELIARATDAAQ